MTVEIYDISIHSAGIDNAELSLKIIAVFGFVESSIP